MCAGLGVQRGEPLRVDPGRIAQLDRQQVGQRRQERQRHRGRVPCGRGLEGLHGDADAHVDDDRRQHRQRQPLHQSGHQPEHPADADEQAGQQGVAAARAHLLVGRLADIGRGLRDAAADAGDQGRQRLDEQHVAGAVVIAGGARAFADVDPAHHHQQAERQQQRQVGHGLRQAVDEAGAGPGELRRQARGFRQRETGHAEPGQAQRVVQQRAHQESEQHARHPQRQRATGDQHVQQQAEGHQPDHRIAQQLDQRQEAEQRQRRTADRTQQRRARQHARDPVAGEREHRLEHTHHHQRGHAQLPGGDRRGLVVEAVGLERDEGRAQHQQGHADAGRRIQAQRHRGDVVAPRAPCQPPRHPGVGQVAQQHAQRGAREHPGEHHLGREAEDPHQRHRDEAEDRQVVDDESEEAVDVAGDEPARCAAGGRCGHAGSVLSGSGSGRRWGASGWARGS